MRGPETVAEPERLPFVAGFAARPRAFGPGGRVCVTPLPLMPLAVMATGRGRRRPSSARRARIRARPRQTVRTMWPAIRAGRRLVDPFAVSDRRGLAFVPGGSGGDRRISRFPRDMGVTQARRRSAPNRPRRTACRRPGRRPAADAGKSVPAAGGDRVGGGAPFGLAAGPRRVALHDRTRAVLYRRRGRAIGHPDRFPPPSTDDAEHRPGAGGFPAGPGVRVGRSGAIGGRPKSVQSASNPASGGPARPSPPAGACAADAAPGSAWRNRALRIAPPLPRKG